VKTLPSALATHYAGNTTTLAQFVEITRADGAVFRFSSVDLPVTVSSNVYVPGLDVTAIANQAGLGGNNLEVTTTYDSTFTRTDFLLGLWNDAKWRLFEANWKVPADGINTLGNYVTGNTTPGEVAVKIELIARGAASLKQSVGIITSKECRARFADYPTPIYLSRCRLSSAAYLVTGTITNVTSQQVVRDSTRLQPADWFAEGVLKFTSGNNIGLSMKVRDYALNGTFTFSLPFPATIIVGDAYQVIAGCRKRRTEDCAGKFANAANFQGEPDLPGQDKITAAPETNS
jgi:uncharacterized phage protein (TIGR02218 family)